MAWHPKRQSSDWRAYLTRDEAATVAEYDKAAAICARLAPEVQAIRNRAIQRRRYEQRYEQKTKD